MKKRFLFGLMAIILAGLGLGGVSLADGNKAKIDVTEYATLADAIANAQDGDTITLLDNVTESPSIEDKNIVLDLGSKTLSVDGWGLDVYNSTLVVKNGTISSIGNVGIYLNYGNNFTLDSTAEIIGEKAGITSDLYPEDKTNPNTIEIKGKINVETTAIFLDAESTLTVNNGAEVEGENGVVIGAEAGSSNVTLNGSIKGSNVAVTINGNITSDTICPTINVGANAELIAAGNETVGLYLAGYGKTTISNGAKLSGSAAGLEIRAGELTINGGIFTSSHDGEITVTPNGNGSTTVGAALAVAQHTTKLPITVTINGGTFNGVAAIYQSNPQNNEQSDAEKVSTTIKSGLFNGEVTNVNVNNKLSIEGGKFSTNPDTSLIVEGKIAKQDGDFFVVGDKELPELQTNIGEQRFVAGSNEWVEFTFTTVPNDYENVMVIGGSDFGVQYEDKIAALEYKVGENTWYDMKGQNFGGNGFPLTDATSTFRVKFTADAAGSYTFNAFVQSTADSTDLATLNVPFTVYEKTKPELTTTITNGKVGVAQSFSFSTVANDYAGTNVVALSQFNDNAALESLYYVYEGQKIDILNGNGQFGADAGFPLADASSNFEVTFKTAGTYTFTVDLVDAANHDIKYATVEKTITITNKSSGGGSSSSSSSSSSSNKTGNNTGATAETGTTNTGANTPTVDPQGVAANGYTNEMNEAYEFAYANGITTMKSIDEAEMFDGLTRIAMAKMLSQYAINVLGKSPADVEVPNFTDVSADLDAEYANGVSLAYKLGIMGINMPDNKFLPYETVTRAQFGTALSRLLFGIEDGEDAYYTTHLAKLKEAGIITNDDPTLEELRGYVMLMLMRSAK